MCPHICVRHLQANFTCGSDVLAVYALINTFSSFVNVRNSGWIPCKRCLAAAAATGRPQMCCQMCCLALLANSAAVSTRLQVDDMTVAAVTAGGTTTPGASASSPVNNFDVGLELEPVSWSGCSDLENRMASC